MKDLAEAILKNLPTSSQETQLKILQLAFIKIQKEAFESAREMTREQVNLSVKELDRKTAELIK